MKFAAQVEQLRGAFSAIFTPFDKQNEINFDMLTKIANYQMDEGLNGFFVTGSTGEGLLLSYEERLAVIEHVVSVANGNVTVIAHVGHPSTDFAAKLAVDSAKVGADWISSVGPIYHGTTFDGAMRHYNAISNATDLPFMVYAMDGLVDPERDKSLFDLPNVCGLKYTGANFFSAQQLNRNIRRPVAFMSGFDEQFVAGQSFGFQGGIGSTYNFAPSTYADIYRLYHEGNIHQAANLQSEINKVTYLMAGQENWSYRKAIMKYIGFDCGSCRAPYARLTDQQFDDYFKELDKLDLLKKATG